jgi:hypothetical protein
MDLTGMFNGMRKIPVDNIISEDAREYMILYSDGSHALGISNNVLRLARRAQDMADQMGLGTVVGLFDGETLYAIDWNNEESGPGGV